MPHNSWEALGKLSEKSLRIYHLEKPSSTNSNIQLYFEIRSRSESSIQKGALAPELNFWEIQQICNAIGLN